MPPPEIGLLFVRFVKMPIDGKGKTDYDENKFILFSAREEPGARMENAREKESCKCILRKSP